MRPKVPPPLPPKVKKVTGYFLPQLITLSKVGFCEFFYQQFHKPTLYISLQPKSICSSQQQPKLDDSQSHSEDDGGGTIKRCPVPETASPAKPASNVPPRPPPPKLPPHRRSSLGNESPKGTDADNSAPEDDGSFRHFWEWLHTPHTEEELEEAWEVLKEVKEEQEKEEEERKSSGSHRRPCCPLRLVVWSPSPRSLIPLFHESINNSPFETFFFLTSSFSPYVHQYKCLSLLFLFSVIGCLIQSVSS